jgi:hypothetical protein
MVKAQQQSIASFSEFPKTEGTAKAISLDPKIQGLIKVETLHADRVSPVGNHAPQSNKVTK